MKPWLVIPLLLALAAVAVVAIWPTYRPAPAPLTPTVDSRPATQPARPAPVVRSATAVKPAAAPLAAPSLTLPDGTFVPLLNGVRQAPASGWWPANVPWSPIIRKEVYADGKEWYIHADGSKSTTVMVWRSDLGREDAAVQVDNPVPVLPLAPQRMR